MAKLTGFILFGLLLFLSPNPVFASTNEAMFAGGCFWCLEHDLEQLSGVSSAESGYSGGDLINPTYQRHNGHQEVVMVHFNPEKISYEDLLEQFWVNIDPFDKEGQFCDRGESYKPLIFTLDGRQKEIANKSLQEISNKLSVPISKIKVKIKDANKFWIAEDYHQNFAQRNSVKYNFYRFSCGRDARLKEVWGSQKGTS